MTVRPITRWGEPVMHRALQRVTVFDDALRALSEDMFDTMLAAEGVGLAANQIGVDLAVFVFDCPDAAGVHQRGVVCNPVVTVDESADWDDDLEGCLSYPGAFVPHARRSHAAVEGLGLDGRPAHVEGDGLLARCLQHETDHLNGIVFGDHLDPKLRKELDKEHRKSRRSYWPSWPVDDAS